MYLIQSLLKVFQVYIKGYIVDLRLTILKWGSKYLQDKSNNKNLKP
jgi:hypothetical protein